MTEERATLQAVPKPAAPAPVDIPNLEHVPLDEIVARAHEMAASGYRLVTLTCIDRGGAFEVMYHFDRDLEMVHLAVEVPEGGKLPSITGAYLCAFLVENEIEDLFGLPVDGLPLDYRRHLVLATDAAPAPLLKRPGQQ